MIYNDEDNQVSCYATITTATTQALTTLLNSHNTAATAGHRVGPLCYMHP